MLRKCCRVLSRVDKKTANDLVFRLSSRSAAKFIDPSLLQVVQSPIVQCALSDDTSEAGQHKTVVVFVSEKQRKELKLSLLRGANGVLGRHDFTSNSEFEIKDFKASEGECRVIYDSSGERRLVLVGLGSPEGQELRTAVKRSVESAIRHLNKIDVGEAAFVLPNRAGSPSCPKLAYTIIKNAVIANHTFDKYKSKKDTNLRSLTFIGKGVEGSKNVFSNALAMAEGTILARELAAERADVADPEHFLKVANTLGTTHSDIRVTEISYGHLVQSGYNLITAVGQGAADNRKPKIIALDYNPSLKEDEEAIVLVGKGITFDTGGLNIKPTGSIETMHYDKGGASAVVGAIHALGSMGFHRRVVGILALAENAVDANSYKPHAYISTRHGSVEVGNTDAEGRLVLADALTWAHDNYKIKCIADAATLTGACVVALGEDLAGVFGNDKSLIECMKESGEAELEYVWPLPITKGHRDQLKGKFTDYKSTGKDRSGGACTAAAFLEIFASRKPREKPASQECVPSTKPQGEVEEKKEEQKAPQTPWVHVDIAGPGCSPAQVGFGASLLARFAISVQ